MTTTQFPGFTSGCFHLAWLFPWSVYFPATVQLQYKPVDRAGKTRLLALCWIGFILVFFTFSTTQEYYSMPCYPAMALLLGSAMAAGGKWISRGTRVLTMVTGLCAAVAIAILVMVRNVPVIGDISGALTDNPEAYTLALGHMEDLTLRSFAYLRFPLAVAALALCVGFLGTWRKRSQSAMIWAALMMVLFFQAARIAMYDFEPFLIVAAHCRRTESVAQGYADHRSSLLLVFVRVFLHQPAGAAAKW